MIKSIVDKFMEKKDALIASFTEDEPGDYQEILERALGVLDDGYRVVHVHDEDSYQGNLAFLIRQHSYGSYFLTQVSYGSCSYCDTFQSICESKPFDAEKADPKKPERAKEYWTLALHMMQRMEGGVE